MKKNNQELWLIKTTLINAASSRVLEIAGQMLVNPMNHFDRKTILSLSNKLSTQVLGLDELSETANTAESENG